MGDWTATWAKHFVKVYGLPQPTVTKLTDDQMYGFGTHRQMLLPEFSAGADIQGAEVVVLRNCYEDQAGSPKATITRPSAISAMPLNPRAFALARLV